MPSYKEYPLENTPYTVREFGKKFHLRQDGDLVAEVPQLFKDDADTFLRQLRLLYGLGDGEQVEKHLSLAEAYEVAKMAWRILDWLKANDRSYVTIDELFDRENGEFALFPGRRDAIWVGLMFIRIAATCGILNEHNMLIIVHVKFVTWISKYAPELIELSKNPDPQRSYEILQELFGEKVIIDR